jgi:hypothetical protein
MPIASVRRRLARVMTARHAFGVPDVAVGERTNGRLLNIVGWITTAVMCIAAIALIVTSLVG